MHCTRSPSNRGGRWAADEAGSVRQGGEGLGRVDLLEQALARANMVLAWKRVKANGGSAGADGLSIEETMEKLGEDWRRIKEELCEGRATTWSWM